MRSLKIERKLRNNPRAKTVRHAPRAGREATKVQPGSARRDKGPGLTGRLGVALKRPMLALTAGLVVLALLAGLLVSGVAGRTLHGVKTAIRRGVAPQRARLGTSAGCGVVDAADIFLRGGVGTDDEM